MIRARTITSSQRKTHTTTKLSRNSLSAKTGTEEEIRYGKEFWSDLIKYAEEVLQFIKTPLLTQKRSLRFPWTKSVCCNQNHRQKKPKTAGTFSIQVKFIFIRCFGARKTLVRAIISFISRRGTVVWIHKCGPFLVKETIPERVEVNQSVSQFVSLSVSLPACLSAFLVSSFSFSLSLHLALAFHERDRHLTQIFELQVKRQRFGF